MRAVQLSDVKARLPELLDDVEQGETIVITCDGRAIARLVPEPQRPQNEIEEAVEAIKRLHKQTGRITLEELFTARHEGHRY